MDISDEDILAENQAVLNSQNGGQLLEIPSLDDPDDGSGQVAQNGADGQLAAQNGADGEQLAQGGADGQTTAPDGNGGQQAADADAQTGLENPGRLCSPAG